MSFIRVKPGQFIAFDSVKEFLMVAGDTDTEAGRLVGVVIQTTDGEKIPWFQAPLSPTVNAQEVFEKIEAQLIGWIIEAEDSLMMYRLELDDNFVLHIGRFGPLDEENYEPEPASQMQGQSIGPGIIIPPNLGQSS